MQKTSLWALFSTFFKIGLFTFGGGYAMLPVISSICVEEKEWITSDEMLNITVIAESTPGPMSINCATYVGYRQGGIPGSIATTVGTVLPSFLIIFTISMFLDNFLEITFIANAFKGIQGAVGILIVDAAITMIRKMKRTPLAMEKSDFLSGGFSRKRAGSWRFCPGASPGDYKICTNFCHVGRYWFRDGKQKLARRDLSRGLSPKRRKLPSCKLKVIYSSSSGLNTFK